MQMITEPLNPELLDILYDYSDWFLSQDLSQINFQRFEIQSKQDEEKHEIPEYYTSEEYFQFMLEKHNNNDVSGFPEHVYGTNVENVESTPQSFREKIMLLSKDLLHLFGARNVAVKMYYPENGFMGWHHNANAPGENLLLSYSKTGNGWFRYKDPKTKETVTMQDTPGWSAKVGYYGSWEEPDKQVWHCARTYDTPRLTIGFIIPDPTLWEMMVEDLVA